MSTGAAGTTEAGTPGSPWYISRRYLLLWLGALLSFTGDMIFEFTLVVWVAGEFGDEGAWQIAGIFVASLVPVILVGPVAGTLVDRWRDKVRIVVRSSLVIAAMTLVLVPLLADGWTGVSLPTAVLAVVLLGAVALISAVNQFIRPATAIISRDIVPERDRGRAASLTQVAIGVAVLVGPPLAAPIFYSLGIAWALVLNALSFVAAALLARAAARGVSSLEVASTVAGATAAAPVSIRQRLGEVVTDLVAGLRLFRASPALVTILTGLVIAIGGFGLLSAVSVFFVINNLGGSESVYGWFGAAEGVGTLVGAAVAGYLVSRVAPARLFWASLVFIGVVLAVYSRQTSVPAGLILIVVLGFGFPFLNVALAPILLRVTPRAYLGRINGTLNPVINAAQVIGVVIGGLVYQAIGPDRALSLAGSEVGALDGMLLLSGVASVVAGVYAWRRFASSAVREEIALGLGGEHAPDDPGEPPRGSDQLASAPAAVPPPIGAGGPGGRENPASGREDV